MRVLSHLVATGVTREQVGASKKMHQCKTSVEPMIALVLKDPALMPVSTAKRKATCPVIVLSLIRDKVVVNEVVVATTAVKKATLHVNALRMRVVVGVLAMMSATDATKLVILAETVPTTMEVNVATKDSEEMMVAPTAVKPREATKDGELPDMTTISPTMVEPAVGKVNSRSQMEDGVSSPKQTVGTTRAKQTQARRMAVGGMQAA